MSSRAEIEACIAEYFLGIGFKQIDRYAHSGSFGDELSFQIDSSGYIRGRFVYRYFSLVPKPGQDLQYTFSLHHARFKGSLTKDDIAVNSSRCGEWDIDFYAEDSFKKIIKLLLDSDARGMVHLELPPSFGI
jgi:hypothetical protein